MKDTRIRPRPGGRRERRRAATRERIFRAALRLFARRGFLETTVEEITEAADVGKGTFFNYFPGKEHVLAGFAEVQAAKVARAQKSLKAGKKPLRGVLRGLLHALAKETARSQVLARALLVATLSSSSLRRATRRNLDQAQTLLEQMIAQGQQRGEVRRDWRPDLLARAFQQAFFGALMLWSLHPPSRLAAWQGVAFDTFWSGIATRKK